MKGLIGSSSLRTTIALGTPVGVQVGDREKQRNENIGLSAEGDFPECMISINIFSVVDVAVGVASVARMCGSCCQKVLPQLN